MVHLKKYKARSKPTTPPPVKWKGLMGLGDEFRHDPSEEVVLINIKYCNP